VEIVANKIYNMDCVEGMKSIPKRWVDLTITSPPYDNLRSYKGYSFDFENVAKELYRITKDGGVVVWVVNDATEKGSESGTSFRQALYFMELGFNLHDTMIYKKKNPLPSGDGRYIQCFEFMFVFSRGNPKTFNPILQLAKDFRDHGKKSTGRQTDGSLKDYKHETNWMVPRQNCFEYKIGLFNTTSDKGAFDHPAMFPEPLAKDQIISWSNEGDLVLDPFMGSGTTGKMAIETGRTFIGFEISKEYCEIAEKRIASVLGQDKLKKWF
jgi:DNA modification methylase